MDTLRRLADKPRAGATPQDAAPPPLTEDFDEFLELFADLRGLVPSSFFLLFKIARTIKTPEAKLNGQLKGFFDVCEKSDRHAPIDKPDRKRLSDEVPILVEHEPHFGERKIKGIEEITLAKPGDVAEEEFTDLLRKAEDRQLNVRVLVRDGQAQAGMETAPIADHGSLSLVNAAEQKLYILLDRSYSMWHRNRLMYAKVLAIEFLRRKKKTNARLFFRPFDFEVYDLVKLGKPGDYDALVRQLLYIEPGGKGTDIAHALKVAAADIAFDGMFEGAEILVITDGMDRVEPDELRQAIGEKIKIHLVKIGRDQADPHDAEIKEMLAKDRFAAGLARDQADPEDAQTGEKTQKDKFIAGLSRDQAAQVFQQRLTKAWDQITETLLETDDLDATDMDLGDDEVNFALAAVDKITAAPVAGLTLAEAETAFRKASFMEGFVEVLLQRADDIAAIAPHKGALDAAIERLHRFKVGIAAKNGINASLLAGKDLHFVNDKSLRKEAKRSKLTMEDLGRLQDSQDPTLQLKLGGAKATPGEGGMSMWQLIKLVGKAAAKSMSGWLFSGDEEDDEEEQNQEKPEKQDK